MSKKLWWLTLGFSLMSSGLSSGAWASPSYPPAIASELGLPCEPACTLCHTRPTGGFATVNTPLGLSVRMDYDLACCDTAQLRDVLGELRDAETDSDGDGASDLDELEALTDPNDERDDAGLACEAPPEGSSGCSVGSAGSAGGSRLAAGVFVVMMVAAAVVRRRFA